MTTQYDVAESENLDQLIATVTAQIARGWKLVGGISTTLVSRDELIMKSTIHYAQALVKEHS